MNWDMYSHSIQDPLPEADRAHMTSVACGWQQRVFSAAMEGFYCGYRAAYEIMVVIDPLVKVRCTSKILTTEFHLGLIQPCSEIERLSETAA